MSTWGSRTPVLNFPFTGHEIPKALSWGGHWQSSQVQGHVTGYWLNGYCQHAWSQIKSFLSLSSKSVEQQEQESHPPSFSLSLLPYPGLWLLALPVKLKTKSCTLSQKWANSIVSSCKWKRFSSQGEVKSETQTGASRGSLGPTCHLLWNQRLSMT